MNQHLYEALVLLRQAAAVLEETNGIQSTVLQRGALDFAKPHVEKVIDAALAELAQA